MSWTCPNCPEDFLTEGMLIHHRRRVHDLPELMDIMENKNSRVNQMKSRVYLHNKDHTIATGVNEIVHKMRQKRIYKRPRKPGGENL